MRGALIHVLSCVVLAATPAGAQWQATADVGVARLRQLGLPEANAPTLGGAASTLGDRWGFGASALAAHSSADLWTVQGLAIGSVRSEAASRQQWNVTGSLSNFSAGNERPTTASEVMAQVRFGSGDRGASVGLGGGFLSHAGTAPLGHAQTDAWQSISNNRFRAEASLVTTRSAVYVSNGSIALQPLSYADFSGSWRREYSALAFGASGGVRTGISGTDALRSWVSAEGTAWFASHAAIVAGAGRTLEDLVRGIPATNFVSVAVRIAARPQAYIGERAPRVAPGARVSVEPMDAARRRIEVRGVTGTRVEVMADFTDWNPVLLDRVGDAWRTEQLVSPGLHRIVLRVDGGDWIVPVNLPHAADELGGVVGLITVP